MSTTRKYAIVAVVTATLLLVLFSPFLFSERTINLVMEGRQVATAERPFGKPRGDVSIHMGQSNVCSLWGGDIFHGPLLIWPLDSGHRFLCLYDYDVEDFAFVVDLSTSSSNSPTLADWPADEWTRRAFAAWATNVVLNAQGVVRLPTQTELRQASSDLARLPAGTFRKASFPCLNLGIYRFYAPIKTVLSDLREDRQL